MLRRAPASQEAAPETLRRLALRDWIAAIAAIGAIALSAWAVPRETLYRTSFDGATVPRVPRTRVIEYLDRVAPLGLHRPPAGACGTTIPPPAPAATKPPDAAPDGAAAG